MSKTLKCGVSFHNGDTYLNMKRSELESLLFNDFGQTCFRISGKEVTNFPAKEFNPYRQEGKIKVKSNDEFDDLY